MKKECPTCRKKVPSRRSLRRDEDFDKLVAILYPDQSLFQQREQEILAKINLASSQQAYRESFEAGMKVRLPPANLISPPPPPLVVAALRRAGGRVRGSGGPDLPRLSLLIFESIVLIC